MDFNGFISVLNSDVKNIKGIGDKKAALFKKLGISTIWDLIYNFPARYEDRTKFYNIASAPENENCCINAIAVSAVIEKKTKKNMSLYILHAEDSTGVMDVKWFSSPFNKRKIIRGKQYTFYGNIQNNSRVAEMILKDIEPTGESVVTGKLFPVYSATSGLSQNDIRKSVNNALNMIDFFFETLPGSIISKYKLSHLDFSIRQMHTPSDSASLEKARRRLAFEELFMLSLALKNLRVTQNIKSEIKITDIRCGIDFADMIPYELTPDQKRTVNEICLDFKSGKPMNRLIQGDVGSGKTAVAACAAYIAVQNGYQVALMAPTEILANQHYAAFNSFFDLCHMRIALLTGSTKNKKDVLNEISLGNADIIIGTHALLEEKVTYRNLGLCITDEQHRFGVKQRAALSKGNNHPHVLVMSATPIPRTLSLVLYGDLDISIIATMPVGRKKVDTFYVNNTYRERINSFMEKEIDRGHQCFVVCPLIEDSENMDAVSGKKTYDRLCRYFGCDRVGFLHGKMSAAEKDEIMKKFRNNEFPILVSTTVIEVGVDVPNATVMVIESAERFGLSQLHQLRGRVGRGNKKSSCILVSDSTSEEARERLGIMCRISDGFKLAEEDLRLRGCGEFFGTRQHGVPELKIANLFTDAPIAKLASEATKVILKDDPTLSSDEFYGLKLRINHLFSEFDNLKVFN